MWRAVVAGKYKPETAAQLEIPKPGSQKTRRVNVFPIPDAAISRLLHVELTRRFLPKFSRSSYAYRPDVSAQDAVIALGNVLRNQDRLYIAEFDFASYFDSINHSYLQALLTSGGQFAVSPAELHAVLALLHYRFAPRDGPWPPAPGSVLVNQSGTPQGNTISLFIANVACAALDEELERTGVWFARYADDLVAVARSYETANAAVRGIQNHCTRAGLKVNWEKSPGIRLLTVAPRAELPVTRGVDFLGYRVTSTSIGPSSRTLRRVRRRLGSIINKNLIYYPSRGFFNHARIDPSARDWDLVNCVNELRRYIYGRLTEDDITASMTSTRNFGRRTGLMAYFPSSDSVDRWSKLDGWMLSAVLRAHRERSKLFSSQGVSIRAVSRRELMTGS
ncbi:MAG TPA: reverse transcriptase domain-containing protein, partial [Nitrospiraceae bacterium]|nr:reverse transcriptase domain-containing protein [Nitrospiraceae bacterium]